MRFVEDDDDDDDAAGDDDDDDDDDDVGIIQYHKTTPRVTMPKTTRSCSARNTSPS